MNQIPNIEEVETKLWRAFNKRKPFVYEEAIEEFKQAHHHQLQSLHTSLVAAVEGKKYKEQVVGAGLLDSQINVNEGLDEALTIINSIFKE